MITTTSSSFRSKCCKQLHCIMIGFDGSARVTPQNQGSMRQVIDSFNCTEDCPIFSDMYDFCRMYAGASLAAARKLCAGTTDIAINWSGGLHHAKRGEASGFCYVNDIVLAILEMLKCEAFPTCSNHTMFMLITDTIQECSTSTSTFIMAMALNSHSISPTES